MGWFSTKSKLPKIDTWVLGYCNHWSDAKQHPEEFIVPIVCKRQLFSDSTWHWSSDSEDLEIEIDWWHRMPKIPKYIINKEFEKK